MAGDARLSARSHVNPARARPRAAERSLHAPVGRSLDGRPIGSNQRLQRLLGRDERPAAVLVDELGLALGNQAIQRVLASSVQRAAEVDDDEEPGEEEKAAPVTQRSSDLGQQIRSEQGRGQMLPSAAQRTLEQGLGAGLGGVRVHADANADQLARAVDAVAFTSGKDVFFRSGAYNPGTRSGLHLIAHEAAHTVQQARGPVAGTPAPGGVAISDPDDAFERAADEAATMVARLAAHPAVAADRLPGMLPVQRNGKSIGLGFSDLRNQDFKADDAFGNRPQSPGNLSEFRKQVGALGPGAFAQGIASQRVGGPGTTGGIQNAFTAGIKQAMAQSLTIKQNLAGFTRNQIDFAHDHPPILTDREAGLARAHNVGYENVPNTDAILWAAMQHVPQKDGGWTAELATVSVWELSHMLHNQHLFDKTEFYYYDQQGARRTAKLTPEELANRGIALADQDLKDLQELGIAASKSDTSGDWFTWLFGCCFGKCVSVT